MLIISDNFRLNCIKRRNNHPNQNKMKIFSVNNQLNTTQQNATDFQNQSLTVRTNNQKMIDKENAVNSVFTITEK